MFIIKSLQKEVLRSVIDEDLILMLENSMIWLRVEHIKYVNVILNGTSDIISQDICVQV